MGTIQGQDRSGRQDRRDHQRTGNMDDSITAIDTIALRIPLDIWAPAPMSSTVCRAPMSNASMCASPPLRPCGLGRVIRYRPPHGDRRVRPLVRRLAVGQSVADATLVPRIERMLLSLSRAGPTISALVGTGHRALGHPRQARGRPGIDAARRRQAHARRMLCLAAAILWQCRAPEAQHRARA